MDYEIERSSSFDTSLFFRDYVSKNKPVIFVDRAKDCAAMKKWNLDFFSSCYGAVVAKSVGTDGEIIELKLAEYIDALRKGARGLGYIRDLPICRLDTSLLEDLPNLGEQDVDLFRHQNSTRHRFKWLYIGPVGSGTELHVDMLYTHSWMMLVSGLKDWVMFPPLTFSGSGKPALRSWSETQDFIRLNPGTARLEFELHPGEIVFVPSGWWHCVRNRDVSVAATVNFMDAFAVEAAYAEAETHLRTIDAFVQLEIRRFKDLKEGSESQWNAQAFHSGKLASIILERSEKFAQLSQSCLRDAKDLTTSPRFQ